jgi:cell division transport system permease protein
MRSFVLQEIWIGLRRNLTMTVALIVVVAISLSLLGTGVLFVKEVDATQTYWQSKVQVSVYLCTADSANTNCHGAVTPAQEAQIETQIKSQPGVADVYFQGQAAAYTQFKSFFSNDPAYVSTVSASDIPASFEVKLSSATNANYQAVYGAVAGLDGVDLVVNEMTILNSFYKLLDGLRNAVIVIALILVVAAILLVSNTIRLSAFNRRRETGIMRLVGASNIYIQMPFLLEGVIAGLIGWVISAGLLYAVKAFLLNSLQQYFSYNVGLTTGDLVEVMVLTMCIAVLLCGATSFLTLRRYLSV